MVAPKTTQETTPEAWCPKELEECVNCPVQACTSDELLDRNSLLAHLSKIHNVQVLNAHELRFIWAAYMGEKARAKDPGTVWGAATDEPTCPDRQLREKLHRQKLQEMLRVQQQERAADATMSAAELACVFCRVEHESPRALFRHMLDEHGFNVGHPDNMVQIREFLRQLRRQLAAACCLQCEVVFKSPGVMRVHMRKKKHLRLNPENAFYDQFYMINYVDPRRCRSDGQSGVTPTLGDDDDDLASHADGAGDTSWGDWVDEVESAVAQRATCLFDARHSLESPEAALEHMRESHGCDLAAWAQAHSWDFYDLVKIVNFMRQRHMVEGRCWQCSFSETSSESLQDHFGSTDHARRVILPRHDWDAVQNMFPVYDNDSLLFALDDVAGSFA